jgi:hypothetical protein
MEIFVDETTRSRIVGEIPSEPLRDLTLKGFSATTPAFRIGELPSTDVS